MTRQRRIPLPEGGRGSVRAYQPDLAAAIDRFYGAATRMGSLDPVATEVLRLRCARHHDCRICQAVRLRDARRAGVDEEQAAKVDHYDDSDLEERLKVLLRFVDAFISSPASVSPELAKQLSSFYRPEQIVEMSLDIMKFSTQKIHVTLGLDTMPGVDVESGAVTYFEFDAEGRPVNFVPGTEEIVPG